MKPKTLFRSSKLFGISKIDVDLLQSYGITKVIDFRSANEIKKAPDPDIKIYKKYKKYSNSNIRLVRNLVHFIIDDGTN
nr:tyrosine-protein phosphatase [Streptococcus pneumoniae]